MNAQQLKNSILQMAVQGKLVPQDPNDEPASVLLERIRAEKEKLIKEGKIKKEKNSSYIFRGDDNLPYEKVGKNEPVCIADEVPFEIPDSWEWCRLGDLFHTIMGQSPSGDTVSEHGNGMEFHQGKICFGDRYLKPSSQTTTAPTKVAPANSVLLCVRAPVGKVNITDREICIGRGLCSVVPLGGISVDFAYILLETYEDIFTKQATGTTFIAITGEVVKNQLVPVPPLPEQIRIINKIEKLSPFVYEYGVKENQLSILNNTFPDSLKKSILQQAVMGKLVPQDPDDEAASVLLERIRAEKQALIKSGKLKKDKHESIIYRRDNSHYEKLEGIERCIDDEIPFDIPSSWNWCRIKTVFNLQAGKNIQSSLISDISNGNDYLCYGGNGIRGYVNYFNHDGDYPIIGRQGALCGNINRATGKFYATEHAVCVDSYADTDISWACLFLTALNLNQYATATAQPGLAVANINEVMIPIPPLHEQIRIVEKYDSLINIINW